LAARGVARNATWGEGNASEDYQPRRGAVIPLAIDARQNEHDAWALPCEIETHVGGSTSVIISESLDASCAVQ
jgi:hypothetical protein